MKHQILITFLILAALVGMASAAEESTAAAQIAVTGISIDPEDLMRGDTGTITVEITNTGDEPVAISRAVLYGDGITVVNERTYDAVGTIGPGISMEFTFTVKASAPDGIYYPKFYLDFRDEGCFRYYIPVHVESSEIVVSVIDAPDTFSKGVSEEVTLLLGNTRDNTLTGITVTPAGEDLESTPTIGFVGTLEPDSSAETTFELTPSGSGDISFIVEYRNGINLHTSTITMPVVFGEQKIRAEPVVNDIEVSGGGSSYTVTGDVTNAGLDTAYSIQVTVGSPGRGTDPYPVDVLGALEPDDFSGFEVTFTAQGASSVPLIIQYKDEAGNTYEESVDIALGAALSAAGDEESGSQVSVMPQERMGRNPMGFGSFGSGLGQIPVIPIVLVIAAGIAGIVAWRKGWPGKVRDRVRMRK